MSHSLTAQDRHVKLFYSPRFDHLNSDKRFYIEVIYRPRNRFNKKSSWHIISSPVLSSSPYYYHPLFHPGNVQKNDLLNCGCQWQIHFKLSWQFNTCRIDSNVLSHATSGQLTGDRSYHWIRMNSSIFKSIKRIQFFLGGVSKFQ